MSSATERFDFGVPWETGYGYSQAVRVGDVLCISGQLSHDADGNFVDGDFELQTKTTFTNLDAVLSHYRANRAQIVQTTVRVKELPSHFDAICQLHRTTSGRTDPPAPSTAWSTSRSRINSSRSAPSPTSPFRDPGRSKSRRRLPTDNPRK